MPSGTMHPGAHLSVSFVILALNEADSIEQAIADCRAFGRENLGDYEVIVIDDGSSDGTGDIVRSLDAEDVRLITHPRNLGMGASMRDGYRAARMDYIAHLPGDRQVRPDALLPMLPLATPDTIVISAFKNSPSGPRRAIMSSVFRLLTRHVGGLRVNFAGTYLFHRKWIERSDFSRADSDTFLFSFQLLELFRRAGARFALVSIPTYTREHGSSREATLSRIARMFVEIGRARLWSRD